MNIIDRCEAMLSNIEDIENNQQINLKSREQLKLNIEKLEKENSALGEELDLLKNALELIRTISDETVQKSYKFIEDNINIALSKIFNKNIRQIKLRESTRGGQYPQLDLDLIVEGGVVRSLKNDSGHGIAQIVSLLSILCIICITGSRKLLILDETISGLSEKSRKMVNDILWSFTEIGFQFIISEHGFIPAGAKVYELESSGNKSSVIKERIEKNGLYLSYELNEIERANIENDVEGEIVVHKENTPLNNKVIQI